MRKRRSVSPPICEHAPQKLIRTDDDGPWQIQFWVCACGHEWMVVQEAAPIVAGGWR